MLSEKDRMAFHLGMYELTETLGSNTKIEYYPFLETGENDLYNEGKYSKYDDPLILVGSIKFATNPSDINVVKGSTRRDIKVEVSIPLKAFYSYTPKVMPIDEEETSTTLTPINPFDVQKGYFVIEGKKYLIESCTPKGLFANDFSFYTYNCREEELL